MSAGQYGVFISAAREPDIELREEKLKELIKNLPLLHYYTLGYLVRHLNRVEAHSNVNKVNCISQLSLKMSNNVN